MYLSSKNSFPDFKTEDNNQLDIFSTASTFLSGCSLKDYDASNSWHNQFRVQVTYRIDEEIFRPLFCADNGADNSSIRVLVGMMILKEAHGLSDAQLFEECRYNLLIRSALGLFNIDDTVASEFTYYLLRKVFHEQYTINEDDIVPRPRVDIQADSVPSPHDSDLFYFFSSKTMIICFFSFKKCNFPCLHSQNLTSESNFKYSASISCVSKQSIFVMAIDPKVIPSFSIV